MINFPSFLLSEQTAPLRAFEGGKKGLSSELQDYINL